MAAEKKTVDWAAVELDYRVGMKTLRAIGTEFGITAAAILKRAKRDGWARDLAGRIRERAQEKVNRAQVNKAVNKDRLLTEAATVEASAQVQADVILAHRADLRRSRELVSAMLNELGSKMLTREEGEQLAKAIVLAKLGAGPDPLEAMAMYSAVLKSVNLADRSGIVKTLAQALTWLVDSERKAFNIDDRTRGANEIVEGLKRLAAMPVG